MNGTTEPLRCTAGAVLLLPLLLAGCEPFHGGSVATAGPPPNVAAQAIAALPVGDIAGAAESHGSVSLSNPFAGDAAARQEGYRLYVKMNCAGCHGYRGEGGIGPSLADRSWRYGGTPVAIFKSLYEGRSQGMPAWNPVMPPAELWKIVAWIESLGGSWPAQARQAALQGDRAGDVVSPHAQATWPEGGGGAPPRPRAGPPDQP